MAEDTHETKIIISGDAKGAVGAFGNVVAALGKVRNAISRVMQAFGVFGLAVHGVQLVIDGIRKLGEWMKRDEVAARRLREEMEKTNAEKAIDRQTEAMKKLNKELAESLRLQKERDEIADRYTRYERDIEDAEAERKKQLEIAGLDPNAGDYDRRKREIERKYERAASERSVGRADEDNRKEADRLYKEAASIELAAAKKRREVRRSMDKNADLMAYMRRYETDADYRSGDKDAVDHYNNMNALWERQDEAIRQSLGEIDDMKAKAKSIREEAASMTGGSYSAKISNEANQQRITNEENAEKAREKREADAKAAAEAAKRQAEADRQAKAQAAAEMREKERRANDLASFAGRVDAFDGVSANRLTAMGLGSGVSAKGNVAGDVKRIADLLKQEVETSKKIAEKDNGSPTGAILGE